MRDVRYALRVLRKAPVFTVAAVTTLALAIGINTAVFSLVHGVLFAPLPYPHPEDLQLVSRVMSGPTPTQDQSVDGRTWELVRDHVTSGDRAPFSTWTTGVNLVLRDRGGAEAARYVQQQRVGAGFFRVLGVAPLLGRELTRDEDRPGGPSAVVISAPLWREAFAANPSIIGQSIFLRGEPYTVIGVMPDGFNSGVKADLWTALRPSTKGEGGGENYGILLRAGDATRAQAFGEVAAVGNELRSERPTTAAHLSLTLVPLRIELTRALRQPMLILWSAVIVVLLAASVNLAGLMLARMSARSREIATRLALGAGRPAVVRQLLTEAIVLGVMGGVAGVAVAYIALDGFVWLARGTYEIWQPVSLGPSAVAVAAALSIVASLTFGLGPAVFASRMAIHAHGAVGAAGGRSFTSHSRRWTRRALVVAQVALGVMLLVGAGLLLRTFTHLRHLDPGFDPNQLTTASVSLEDARYATAERVAHLAEAGIARMEQLPGIEAAGLSLGVPYQRLLNIGFRRLNTQGEQRGSLTSATYVTPRFFEAMRIPVRRGRALDARDRIGAPPAAVVNEAFVRAYFADSDPLGQHILLSNVDWEIVGVVGNVQLKPGWGDFGPLSVMPLAYVPLPQVPDRLVRLVHGWFLPTFVVRSSLPPAQTAATIREALAAVDPLLPLASVRPMSEVQATSLAQQRLLMTLLLGLALAAVAVAATGIHGLIATSVTERTREMGIRLALGATSQQALRTIVLPGVVLAAAGIGAGLVAAFAATPLVAHFVWGVRVTDPVTFTSVALLLLFVALAASVLPAWRIVQLDPARTLREG
jgi:putative ABC transport system permease protein